jgi:hypothetical protein
VLLLLSLALLRIEEKVIADMHATTPTEAPTPTPTPIAVAFVDLWEREELDDVEL